MDNEYMVIGEQKQVSIRRGLVTLAIFVGVCGLLVYLLNTNALDSVFEWCVVPYNPF